MYLRAMRPALILALPFTLLAVACAKPAMTPAAAPTSAEPQAAAPPAAPKESSKSAEAPAEAPPAEPAGPSEIPNACTTIDGICTPDAGFVKRLCTIAYPEVALVLLGKDAPFTRMYMRGDVDAWNADGGSSTRARLAFDEEVLVLRRRAPAANGIVQGSGPAYLVMRWDGNCYTLEDAELTPKRPPAPKHGPVPWRAYSDKTKDALFKSPKVLAAFQRRGKECKGASSGVVSRACEQADSTLAEVVVTEIRAGIAIPTPDHRP